MRGRVVHLGHAISSPRGSCKGILPLGFSVKSPRTPPCLRDNCFSFCPFWGVIPKFFQIPPYWWVFWGKNPLCLGLGRWAEAWPPGPGLGSSVPVPSLTPDRAQGTAPALLGDGLPPPSRMNPLLSWGVHRARVWKARHYCDTEAIVWSLNRFKKCGIHI